MGGRQQCWGSPGHAKGPRGAFPAPSFLNNKIARSVTSASRGWLATAHTLKQGMQAKPVRDSRPPRTSSFAAVNMSVFEYLENCFTTDLAL